MCLEGGDGYGFGGVADHRVYPVLGKELDELVYAHGAGAVELGVLVDVVGGDETLAKDIAMHIAASKPVSLSKEQVPAELIEKERTIAAAKAAESGKPANIVEKMVEGSVQKYLKEVTLLGQLFVKNDKQTIEQLLKANKAEVASFSLFIVGEVLEKKKDDFAAEVMAAVQAANKIGRAHV